MASAGVLNCFEVLINGISIMIESNLRNLDLTWNLLFGNCSIFEIKAIDRNMVILNKGWGYLNTIQQIYSKFYGCQMPYYHAYTYLSSITMITLLLIIMMIVLLEQGNSYFWMLLDPANVHLLLLQNKWY